MKRISQTKYKKSKALKQLIKSIPEKETDKPLLRSTVRIRARSYDCDLAGLIFPLLMMNAMRHNNISKMYGPSQIKDKGRNV